MPRKRAKSRRYTSRKLPWRDFLRDDERDVIVAADKARAHWRALAVDAAKAKQLAYGRAYYAHTKG